MHTLLRALLPLSPAALFAIPFLLFSGPWGAVAAIAVTYVALHGMAMHQRVRSGLPLRLDKVDRAAVVRTRRLVRSLFRGDVERAQAHLREFPDTPVGRALEVQCLTMVLFARGRGTEGVEAAQDWLRTHPHDDALRRKVAHQSTEYAAMLLVLGQAEPAAVLPTLPPAVTGSTRAHRRRGCMAEFALDLREGRVDRATAQARRWRRRARTRPGRVPRAEAECLVAICAAAAGDLPAARRALAAAERRWPVHPAIGPARARVAAGTDAPSRRA
ncbi:hypothetical protein [Embleya hyalina]|uniref:Uncharacterized protein n=1 Tax=Embleya hyalina TaxID=516124 RepID=A0A401Z1C2_9ACTN|nr:hypothetical protein [Embleya hyalina]GCE00627.1 hypothetical protein EHYA_08353 [Embleya hyalina]